MLPLSMAVVVFIAALSYIDWDRSRSVRQEVLRLQRVLQSNEMVLSSIKDLGGFASIKSGPTIERFQTVVRLPP